MSRRPLPALLRSRLAAAALVASTLAPLPAIGQGGIHVVAPGDTLSALARRYATSVTELRTLNGLPGDLLRVGTVLELPAPPGWSLRTAPAGSGWEELADAWRLPERLLREANPDVRSPGGHELRVPPAVGDLATPREGEDLLAFATRVGAAPGALATRNGLTPPYALEPGLPLLLPAEESGAGNASPAAAATVAAPVAAVSAVAAAPDVTPPIPGDLHETLRARALERLPTLLDGVALSPPDDGFAWPLAGPPRITSRFGWRAISVGGNRYHLGLDLGAPSGTAVLAARDGTVTRAGWTGAYGYAVYLRHADGYETRYAHLARIGVTLGDEVLRGDAIGAVGSTGASTGPHLHFEVRADGSAVDPLAILPEAPAGASRSR
jgi:murein DD-endopeptidase MepM/ murein hydrolase activator NlpD